MLEQLKEQWDNILLHVKEEHDIMDVSFNTWLLPLKIFAVDGNVVKILAPDAQMLRYIQKKYGLILQVSIEEVTGFACTLDFITEDDVKEKEKPEKMLIQNTPGDVSQTALQNANLNPRYTFDTFVVGANNNLAHAAALAVAESPGEVYNPLFIYGGVGLGKTHLMHSIAHFIQSTHPALKVLYVSSETFTNELIEAIRNGNNMAMSRFREKYRSMDVLLIDDVQFIIGKESTQEEFFHTFNELHVAKKQIILSSDRPPKEMETLEERIRSRFEWGLLADIGSPDYETRMAILRKKEELDGVSLDDAILNYIALNIKSNIRELEGALNKLVAYENLVQTEITMEIAEKELQNIISPDIPLEVTPQLVVEVVAEHFGITMDQITSKSRSNDVAKPRQIAMYLCKNMTDASLETIGKAVGGRDHSTVVHGIKKVGDDISTDTSVERLVATIRKKINPH